jgi:hypothetical protein
VVVLEHKAALPDDFDLRWLASAASVALATA